MYKLMIAYDKSLFKGDEINLMDHFLSKFNKILNLENSSVQLHGKSISKSVISESLVRKY